LTLAQWQATPVASAYPGEVIGPTVALGLFFAVIGLLSASIVGGYFQTKSPRRLMVRNFRNRSVPAAGGIVLIFSLAIAYAAITLAGPLPPKIFPAELRRSVKAWPEISLVVFFIAAGFFALGLIDDLSAGAQAKGLKGHLKALAHFEITGGIVKMAGGLALGFAAAAALDSRLAPAIVDGLLIAGIANLLNLLDLRPGRACKVFLIIWGPLAGLGVAGRGSGYVPVSSALTGAVLAWVPGDLAEAAMLGDSGSNTLGAVVGVGFVLVLGLPARAAVLAIVLALTIVSEKLSFSTAIDRIAPLRWLDNLGRPRLQNFDNEPPGPI